MSCEKYTQFCWLTHQMHQTRFPRNRILNPVAFNPGYLRSVYAMRFVIWKFPRKVWYKNTFTSLFQRIHQIAKRDC